MLHPVELDLAGLLNSRGYKLTRQRRAILQVIGNCNGHLDPAEVYEKARAADPHIGLTTVYRTLEVLNELGAVRRVHLDSGCHSYAPASVGHRHHLICSHCNSVVEFAGCDLSGVLRSVSAETGFQMEGHWLQLFGLCPDCQAEVKNLPRNEYLPDEGGSCEHVS